MRTTLREMTALAPVAAALSLLLYAFALELWPLRATRLFATLFGLDALNWQPAHGWPAVAFGIVVWAGASYTGAAAAWVLWRRSRRLLQAIGPHAPLRASLPSAARGETS